MSSTVEYCLNNVDDKTRRKLQRGLGKECGFKIIEDFCLGHCGDCFEGPYLLVDGELVQGPSHEAIIKDLKLKVRRAQLPA